MIFNMWIKQNIVSGAALVSLLLFGCSESKQKRVKTASVASSRASSDLQLQTGGSRSQMISQAEQLKNSIKLRFPQLQTERDRQGKITAELLNQSSQGCFSNVSLQKIEILVKGSWLPRKARGKTGSPMSSRGQGSPYTMTFQFGDQIAIVNDEQTQSMFQPAGRKVVSEFGDLKLSDIEFVRISKGGALFDSERVCRRSGFLGTGEKCSYQNYEETRYELDSLELKVNGETFYKRDAIKHQFEDGAFEWRDDSMNINEAYLKLMGRQDCPQG